MFAIKLFFAGLWPLVWHWGIPVGIIIICLVAEVAIATLAATSPWVAKWLVPLQKDLLWVAVVAGFFLFAFADGVRVEHTRTVAQGNALTRQIGRVVDEVVNDPANQPQPIDEPNVSTGHGKKHAKSGKQLQSYKPLPHDQWDNPEN
jgi:hypothetical protein